MGAVSISTPEDIEKAGGKRAILPMTVVWSIKKEGCAHVEDAFV